MLGEAFVMATADYASGWPARFHVVSPWLVNVEMAEGRRRYTIGAKDVTADILHLRYQSRTDDAHGHGPLEAGAGRLVLESLLTRYVSGYARSGGVPSSILTHPDQLTATQSADLQSQWVSARLAAAGAPAVLSGGVTWQSVQASPVESGSSDLMAQTQARIAILLGVPPYLVGLPSGGDSMTYANVSALFDFHWRSSLRPKAGAAMAGLSGFVVPRGVGVELNRDAYIQAGPLERAQAWQALHGIVDPDGTQALSAAEVRAIERVGEGAAGGLAMPAPAGPPDVTTGGAPMPPIPTGMGAGANGNQ
jgi:HK97 family phage portal protein